MPPAQQQQHPRDIIRNALAAHQQQQELPIKGYHILFMMVSIIIAACILVYEIQVLTSSEDNDTPLNKWFKKSTKPSSIRYLTNIKDIKGNYYYDYIIVGAGTAGSILATKLSHFDNTYPRILVIEKSKSKRSLMQNKNNKITAFENLFNSDQLQIESINNHNTWIKSSLKKYSNNIWSIGHPSDYNILWNITEWSYDNILPYFQSSEKVHISEIIDEFATDITDENELNLRKENRKKSKGLNGLFNKFISILPLVNKDILDKQFNFGDKDITKNRGNNGKLLIKQARKYSIVNAFIVNAISANYEYNVDYNSFFNYNTNEHNAMVNTVSYQQYNKHGIFESYIDKLKKSKFAKNHKHMIVDVLFNTQVNKILFHDIQKTSDGKHIGIGVQVVYNSTKHDIYLRDDIERNNEVILSAGTVDSPRILMRSGFGNAMYLKQCCDIDVIEENVEIGKNLQDQIKFSVYFRHNSKFKVIAKYEIWKWKYKIFSGTLVNASGYDANIFYNPVKNVENNIDDVPQIQFMLYNGIKPTDIYNLKNEKCINTEIFDGITIDIILLHPKSKGFVDMNVINPAYLSDKNNEDLGMLLKGYREVERIFFNKEPFDGVVTFGPFWPCNESINNYNDDESIQKYIVNNIQSNNNWIGTNRMNVVVDHEFVLNNTLNVRIVDGSVMPSLISGSVQAPIVMMAHKASDIIIRKRLNKNQQINNHSIDEQRDIDDDVPRHSEL